MSSNWKLGICLPLVLAFAQHVRGVTVINGCYFYGNPCYAVQLTASYNLGEFGTDTTLNLSKTTPGTTYAGPSVSFNGTTDLLTFSRSSGGYEVDEVGYNYGATAFANGTYIVGAGGFQGPGSGGPITLHFTIPVAEFGLNLEEYNTGFYFVDFTAYDATGVDLGTYFDSGVDPSSLSFEGLAVSGDLISTVVFDDVADCPPPVCVGSNNLLFGNIEYYPSTVPLQAAAPEPSTFLLLASGFLTFGYFANRLHLKKK